MTREIIDTAFVVIFFIIIAIVYALPSIIAFRRRHPNRWVIMVINIAFGGTIIGWGIALAWAFHAAHLSKQGSSGGESGLNLFVNDTKKVEIIGAGGWLGQGFPKNSSDSTSFENRA